MKSLLITREKLRTVVDVLKAINDSVDTQEVKRLENILVYMLLLPVIGLCSLISFIVSFFVIEYSFTISLINFGFFIFSGLVIHLIIKLKLNVNLTTHLLSIWISVWLLFTTVFYFQYAGPSIQPLGFVLILLTLFRITITMLLYVSAGTIIMGIWLWIQYNRTNFYMDHAYFTSHFLFYTILFVITTIVYRINSNRFRGIQDKLLTITKKNIEMEILNRNLDANTEILLQQNKDIETSNILLKKNEELLNQLAYFDDLTKLPNRKMLLDRLNLLIHQSGDNPIPFYLIFLDLDNFKIINDTMGHRSGDMLLQEIVSVLKSVLHPEDTLGRIGGDEFTILIHRNLPEDKILSYANNIRLKLASPVLVDHVEIHSSASFGIAMFPKDGTEVVELMKCADMAMYKAKEIGRNTVRFFESCMRDEIHKKIELEIYLRKAIDNDLFWLALQPQFYCSTQKLRGFEVLLRLEDKNLSPVSPEVFIPVAEETGLIIPIGIWVIRESIRYYQRLERYIPDETVVSINISSKQLLHPGFTGTISTILEETGIDPVKIEFEITESVFIENLAIAIATVNDLHNMGIKIALDDFGTGYSSLNYLRALPIDILKIDRSFVDNIIENPVQANLLRDIIMLVHNLSISVVSEGVESESQKQYLQTYGCDIIQGFLLGKPMREKDFLEFIKATV
jgi:diguanylate cyclase (GGDEF)-like protein